MPDLGPDELEAIFWRVVQIRSERAKAQRQKAMQDKVRGAASRGRRRR